MRQANSRLDIPSGVEIERELVVCQLYVAGPIVINNGVQTAVLFTGVDEYDPLGMHNPAVNPDRITLVAPVPPDATGVHISGWCKWDMGSGFRELTMLENGGGTGNMVAHVARTTQEIEQCVEWVGARALPVGKYFGLNVFSDITTNLLEARFEIKLTFK